MAQGLQLSQRLTQSLVLAPQLQQSLALLQAPTLELKALVEQELQQNPVLEEASASETEMQDEEKRQFMFDSLVAGTSLQEMLIEQVRESELTDEQRPIAELLIGNIDDY